MPNLDAVQLFSLKGIVVEVTDECSDAREAMAHALNIHGAAQVSILGG